MREALSFLQAYSAYFIIGILVLLVVQFILFIVLSKRVKQLKTRRNAKIEAGSVGEISDCLSNHADTLSDLGERINAASAKLSETDLRLESCTQRIGIVRFDAFDDIGGEQSFALAMLDAKDNGVVISSIFGRQLSRQYAKAIVAGLTEQPLSDEERIALSKATKVERS